MNFCGVRKRQLRRVGRLYKELYFIIISKYYETTILLTLERRMVDMVAWDECRVSLTHSNISMVHGFHEKIEYKMNLIIQISKIN